MAHRLSKFIRQNDMVHTGIFCGLVLVFLYLTIGSIIHKSLTYDEPQHYRYGEQILNLNSDRFDDSKMPVSALNVMVSKLAVKVLGERLSDPWHVMSAGRLATIFFSLGVAILVYVWARDWYGKNIGLLAMALYMLEPNIIAHSRLITTDIYATGTITLALYLFWRFLEKPNYPRAIVAASALGLCQIAKYTGLFLYPLFLILVLLNYWERYKKNNQSGTAGLTSAILSFIKYAFLFLTISIVIINIGFLFNNSGKPLGDYQFKSDPMQTIQNLMPSLRSVPIPVPYPYLDGLDQVLYNEKTGENYGSIYLLGETREGEGFPGYFFIASIFKVPIPILILFCVALAKFIRDVFRKRVPSKILYIVFSGFYFFLYFNFIFRAQIGFRFSLVVFPIILIFSVGFFQNWYTLKSHIRGLFIFLGMYLVISIASYFPHYLSYFNEFVPNRNLAYQILADSNIDWGQNRADLQEYLEENPEVIFQPSEPIHGDMIIGVNELTGVLGSEQKYQWLRDNFQPIGNLDYTYLIYRISEDDLVILGQLSGQ